MCAVFWWRRNSPSVKLMLILVISQQRNTKECWKECHRIHTLIKKHIKQENDLNVAVFTISPYKSNIYSNSKQITPLLRLTNFPLTECFSSRYSAASKYQSVFPLHFHVHIQKSDYLLTLWLLSFLNYFNWLLFSAPLNSSNNFGISLRETETWMRRLGLESQICTLLDPATSFCLCFSPLSPLFRVNNFYASNVIYFIVPFWWLLNPEYS